MTAKILIVTAPDDTLLQGIRITHVNLTADQSQLVSQALMQSQSSHTIINYVWNIGDDTAWFIDKIYKSDLVIFDAEHIGGELVGGGLRTIESEYGHDGFLIEFEMVFQLVSMPPNQRWLTKC
jgi:homoserine acetyltransferase